MTLCVTPDAIDCHQEAANMPYMTADALVERMKGIPEFILSKIAEILDCYDKETTVSEGFLFECCPKCRAIHPRIIFYSYQGTKPGMCGSWKRQQGGLDPQGLRQGQSSQQRQQFSFPD